MDKILELLKERNTLLRKFYTLNKAEIFRLSEGDFSRLEYFYKSRDNILELIAHIEQKVNILSESIDKNSLTSVHKNAVKSELNTKESVVNEILEQDLSILSYVDTEKSRIIKELGSVTKAKSAVSAYHSEGSNRKLRSK